MSSSLAGRAILRRLFDPSGPVRQVMLDKTRYCGRVAFGVLMPNDKSKALRGLTARDRQACWAICMRLPHVSSNTAVVTGPMAVGG